MNIKSRIGRLPFINEARRKRQLINWINAGKPIPVPHEVKQLTILFYAIVENASTLVETGTYLGDTIWEQRNNFREIYSIELSPELFKRAQRRFAGTKNVTLLHGDSGRELKNIVAKLKSPALFWLDGHYSGGATAKGEKECPILEELKHIFASPLSHTVLIDDARLFVGANDYPTVLELADFVSTHGVHRMSIQNDIIVLLPNEN
jgi:hypothetical protein